MSENQELPQPETVLVFGATGDTGVAAIIATLRSGRKVLAVVRNQDSADKMFRRLGTRDGIIIIEASAVSEEGVNSVVDRVRAGEFPDFQHVWCSTGGIYWDKPLLELEASELREAMMVNFESNVLAYKATMPYLLEKGDPRSTWSLCTGSQGDTGDRAAPALSQGALFSFAAVACRDNEHTNVRFNEVYTSLDVKNDLEHGDSSSVFWSSEFARVYEGVLGNPEIRGCRVTVGGREDIVHLRYEHKLEDVEPVLP